MIKFQSFYAPSCFIAASLFIFASGFLDPALAQRQPNGPGRDGYSGRDGGGGGPNIGRFIFRYGPAILNKLNDRDPDEKPRRRAQPRQDAQDRDPDERPKRPRRPRRPAIVENTPPLQPPPRIVAIPPLPPVPPDRIAPPALPTAGTPPPPFKRAALFAERPAFKEGELVVLVRAAEPDALAAQLAQNFNLVLQETLQLALLNEARVYRFSIPDNRAPETITTAMAAVPGVGFAAPNAYYWLQGKASASALEMQYALPKMRVPDAQEVASGDGMIVAVIDSGVDANHSALRGADLQLIDVVADGVEGPDMHGTAVAGIIAASGELVGVAPGAKILAVRAFAPERAGSPPVTTAATLAKAVDRAFAQGARIFNMSFAGEREPLLIEMIDAAYERGAVFVAAAGNNGPDAPPAYPAAHEKVIAITATDRSDGLYEQANRGGYVAAAAPGVDILVPVTGQSFDYLSGTSFAAAHVTGVIAMLMERNPRLDAEGVRRAVAEAATDLGPKGRDDKFGAGLTDAYAALMAAGMAKAAAQGSPASDIRR